jgi:hypothetical protein
MLGYTIPTREGQEFWLWQCGNLCKRASGGQHTLNFAHQLLEVKRLG